MALLFSLLTLCLVLFSSPLVARPELIVTVPKSGTNYLEQILTHLLQVKTILPEILTPAIYANLKYDMSSLVIWHTDPSMYSLMPQNQPTLLLIRDPRDVVLSAIDFVNTKGLLFWPGLGEACNTYWHRLTKKEQAEYLIDGCFDDGNF